ncbi:sugar phosphate isomerase/epimerase [Christensenellaceae bacterium OttesenSCG-928-K19]|nr:sugar phosphate isomerase/epimerase [Christensenellaceae bacterium OttesenSCG-928-K19]
MKFGMNSLAWQSPFSDPMGMLEKAKKYGCDIFEIAAEDFSTFSPDAVNDAVQKTGIPVYTICGAYGDTRDISSENPEYRQNAIQYNKDMIDLCVKIGAKVVAGPMYSAVGKARQCSEDEKKQQWDWAVENLRIVADYANEKGIKLGIEPLNRFETDFINTVEQGLDLIARIDKPGVGFLLDTFHMNIEESNIPAAIRSAKGKIYDMHCCANNRGIPGEDNFNWPAIADAVKDAGYDDYILIESFTPDCVEIAKAASVWRPFAESPEAIAERGIPFLKKTFTK